MIRDIFGSGRSQRADNADEPVYQSQEDSAFSDTKAAFDRIDTEASNWETSPAEDESAEAGAEDFVHMGGEIEKAKEKSISVIAAETKVMGDITTAGHIDIIGSVEGNVVAEGNIAVQGSIRGDVTGGRIGLYECRVAGDVTAAEGIVAGDSSIVVGNVKTKNLILDGKLKGDIRADDVVVFRENAYYLGDVTTGSIAIETGAVINGNIKTFTEGNPEAPFDE